MREFSRAEPAAFNIHLYRSGAEKQANLTTGVARFQLDTDVAAIIELLSLISG